MKHWTRGILFAAFGVGAAGILAYRGTAQQAQSPSPEVTVYKSPT